jgi:uncharacterized protein
MSLAQNEMIYETIVISTDADGQPHIAPLGVRERDGLCLIAPYRPSSSLDNLLRSKNCVLNLTDDVRAFAGALTGHRDWPVKPAEKISGFVLESALSHRELELSHVIEHETRPELYFKTVHQAMHAPFLGFNRAQAAVIELAVLVSRLHILPMDKIRSETRYLEIAMQKTAGEREWQAWQWLIDKVDTHQATINGLNIA